MLTTKNVGYWYGKEDDALYKEVNLDFDQGKLYGIVGPSGSGKTTLLTILSGLDKPSTGIVEFEDTPISKIGLTKFRNQYVSIVFQSYNLLPYMSAVDNVVTAMKITNSISGNSYEYALEALKKVGIDETLAKKNVQKLSGGQQQRVAVVRAMCCSAPIVVADEPTGNLDGKNTQEIIKLFQDLAHQENKCVIIVTHEKDVAESCDIQLKLQDKQFQEV